VISLWERLAVDEMTAKSTRDPNTKTQGHKGTRWVKMQHETWLTGPALSLQAPGCPERHMALYSLETKVGSLGEGVVG